MTIIEDDDGAISVNPPPCIAGHEHDWRAPVDLVGPGVTWQWRQITARAVCAHCGLYRIITVHSWDPNKYIPFDATITYNLSDAASLAWVSFLTRG